MVNTRKLKAQMVLMDVGVDELANKMNVHPKTMYRKLNNPGKLKQTEMEQIAKILGITNLTEIFFATE